MFERMRHRGRTTDPRIAGTRWRDDKRRRRRQCCRSTALTRARTAHRGAPCTTYDARKGGKVTASCANLNHRGCTTKMWIQSDLRVPKIEDLRNTQLPIPGPLRKKKNRLLLTGSRLFSIVWRRRPDSNRRWGFCRPLPYHLATSPEFTCIMSPRRCTPSGNPTNGWTECQTQGPQGSNTRVRAISTTRFATAIAAAFRSSGASKSRR